MHTRVPITLTVRPEVSGSAQYLALLGDGEAARALTEPLPGVAEAKAAGRQAALAQTGTEPGQLKVQLTNASGGYRIYQGAELPAPGQHESEGWYFRPASAPPAEEPYSVGYPTPELAMAAADDWENEA